MTEEEKLNKQYDAAVIAFVMAVKKLVKDDSVPDAVGTSSFPFARELLAWIFARKRDDMHELFPPKCGEDIIHDIASELDDALSALSIATPSIPEWARWDEINQKLFDYHRNHHPRPSR